MKKIKSSLKLHNPLTLIYGYIYCANNGVSNQPIQFLQGLSAIFCCLPLHLAFFFARRKDSRIHRPKSAKIAFLLHSGATITVILQGCRVSNFRSCSMQLKICKHIKVLWYVISLSTYRLYFISIILSICICK